MTHDDRENFKTATTSTENICALLWIALTEGLVNLIIVRQTVPAESYGRIMRQSSAGFIREHGLRIMLIRFKCNLNLRWSTWRTQAETKEDWLKSSVNYY